MPTVPRWVHGVTVLLPTDSEWVQKLLVLLLACVVLLTLAFLLGGLCMLGCAGMCLLRDHLKKGGTIRLERTNRGRLGIELHPAADDPPPTNVHCALNGDYWVGNLRTTPPPMGTASPRRVRYDSPTTRRRLGV